MGGSFFNIRQPDVDMSSLKHELKKQEGWIGQLHHHSRELHKFTSYINDSNAKHKKEMISQLNSVIKWIDHFNESHITLKKEINELRTNFRKTLRNDFEAYHKLMEEYLRLKLDDEKISREKLRQEITNELKAMLTQKPEPKYEIPKQEAKIADMGSELTNPEKELLNLLFNEGKPLTYEQMASKLHKSVSSIRVYMNSLKVKRPIVEEFATPAGVKVFSIKNSEVVKTLFNLSQI
jgi:hypothetical protein